MNKEKFTQEVLNAEQSLYHVAKSILRNDEDCADAIQNGIYKAYSKLDTLKKEVYFKTWITRIVINECYGILREKKRFVSLDEYERKEGILYEEILCQRDLQETEIYAMLMELDEKYRIPIILHKIEGYSVREISRILNITEVNVRNRLSRGKAMLRKKMKGEKSNVI